MAIASAWYWPRPLFIVWVALPLLYCPPLRHAYSAYPAQLRPFMFGAGPLIHFHIRIPYFSLRIFKYLCVCLALGLCADSYVLKASVCLNKKYKYSLERSTTKGNILQTYRNQSLKKYLFQCINFKLKCSYKLELNVKYFVN